jgi:hypothetical protein
LDRTAPGNRLAAAHGDAQQSLLVDTQTGSPLLVPLTGAVFLREKITGDVLQTDDSHVTIS